jgi:hypothetical protein
MVPHPRGARYVMAVPVDLPLVDPGGRAGQPPRPAPGRTQRCGVGAPLRRQRQQRLRYYDWAAVAVKDQPSVSEPEEIEGFLAHAPAGTPIPELIAVVGIRWRNDKEQPTGPGRHSPGGLMCWLVALRDDR